jgi:hypothetical protein
VPKAAVAGDKTAGYTPVPLSCAAWGEVEELSLTLRVPETVPRTVGVKLTEMVQLAPAASVFGALGHFEVCPKFPRMEILLIVRGVAWVFVKVTVLMLVVRRT